MIFGAFAPLKYSKHITCILDNLIIMICKFKVFWFKRLVQYYHDMWAARGDISPFVIHSHPHIIYAIGIILYYYLVAIAVMCGIIIYTYMSWLLMLIFVARILYYY